MTQKQNVTSDDAKNTNNVSVEEDAFKTMQSINERLKKIESNTSMQRRAIEGTIITLGAGGVAVGVYALGKWIFGGPKPVAVIPMVPGA